MRQLHPAVAAPRGDGCSSDGGGRGSSGRDGLLVAIPIMSCVRLMLVLVTAKTLAGCNIFVQGCNSVMQTLGGSSKKACRM